jgi:hypothetical protein
MEEYVRRLVAKEKQEEKDKENVPTSDYAEFYNAAGLRSDINGLGRDLEAVRRDCDFLRAELERATERLRL